MGQVILIRMLWHSYRFTHALKDAVYFSYADRQTDEGKFGGIIDYASITPSVRYFNPRRVFQDGKRVVIVYNADANDKGALVVSLVQADGKILFTRSGSELEPIRNLLSSSHEQFEYKSRLHFYAQREEAEIAVLNQGTG